MNGVEKLSPTPAQVQTLEALAQTLQRSPRSTIAPPQEHVPSGARVLEVLRALGRPAPAVEDEGLLGRGGMGEVRLATQVTLGRKVAVKRLSAGHTSETDVEALLAESWLSGALEHPNIVPVYDLGLDAAGLPVLVMKRVEGMSWASLLRDPAALATHAPHRTPLEAHLRILMQVCNALHYAHARGVVHRDVKPDNVMVGNFGEVYLVDWGIAVSEGPSPQLAGTPVYMAPEMLGGPGALVSARTDVYLLGAVLFELLTGAPPHDASSPEQLAQSVLASAPALPDSAPLELAALVRLCMSAAPAHRPDSALAVRVALDDFLSHLGSLELTAQAELRLRELQRLLAEAQVAARQVFDLYSACRFGFQQALREWPENGRARHGLGVAVHAMVRFELSAGSARSAQSLLSELTTPAPALVAEVERAIEAETAQRHQLAQLEALAHDHNPRTGGRQRARFTFFAGVTWVAAPLVGIPLIAQFPQSELMLSVFASAVTTLSLLVLNLSQQPWRSQLNGQLLRLSLFFFGAQLVGLAATQLIAGNIGPLVAPLLCGGWFVLAGIIAAGLLAEIWPIAVGYAVAMAVSLLLPAWRYEAMSLGNLVLCLTAWRLSRQATPDER